VQRRFDSCPSLKDFWKPLDDTREVTMTPALETEMLRTVRLSADEQSAIAALLADIQSDPRNREETLFLRHATILAHELPKRIRELFYDFKLCESTIGLLVTGNPIAPDVGPTPRKHWRKGEPRPLNSLQMLHGLYVSLLGEPFGFETQQHGRIFNDLIPVREAQDNSSSGGGNIGLHTEDCFDAFMPDYLGLMCLRNQERAVSVLSTLTGKDLPGPVMDLLFEDRFPVTPVSGDGRCDAPPKTSAILFGDPKRPYMRINPGRIDLARCDPPMITSLRCIMRVLAENRKTVVLAQGDAIYLDNFAAVHGREPYQPSYGGDGRWFSRLIVARDLRKTRVLRDAADSRVVRTV
jgi:L-asparagine oxygenase